MEIYFHLSTSSAAVSYCWVVSFSWGYYLQVAIPLVTISEIRYLDSMQMWLRNLIEAETDVFDSFILFDTDVQMTLFMTSTP